MAKIDRVQNDKRSSIQSGEKEQDSNVF